MTNQLRSGRWKQHSCGGERYQSRVLRPEPFEVSNEASQLTISLMIFRVSAERSKAGHGVGPLLEDFASRDAIALGKTLPQLIWEKVAQPKFLASQ